MNITQLLAVLGHELRTPLAAILGYNELLTDGIYGEVPDRQRDALARINASAVQLVRLLDGVNELAAEDVLRPDAAAPVHAAEALARVFEEVAEFASSRSVTLQLSDPPDIVVMTAPERFRRALEMMITAAVKASPGLTLGAALAEQDGKLLFDVVGSSLDPERDSPDLQRDRALTGSGLRLAIATRTAKCLGGTITLKGGDPAVLRLTLPLSPVQER